MVDLLDSNDHLSGHNYIKLFSQAPAPIAIYRGRELRYVFINDAYSKIFGGREILGKTIREAFPELEGQPYFGILENVYDTGNPFYGNETPALIDVKNDGVLTTRYYNLVYTPYKNDDGQIDGVMAFGHDVTEQVEARQRERESDLRFRNIVEQSKDPILILKGRDLTLDVANEALLNLWNIDTQSIGKAFLEILPEMKDQGFYDLLLDVYENGNTHYGREAEVYFKRPNEEPRRHFFNFSYQPYYEADNNIAGVLVLATDVTEQVIAKRNLAQSEINFQNMVLQAPVAMCVLEGADFVVGIANERMCQLWGDGSRNLAGTPIFEAFPQAKEQGLEEILNGVYHKGEPFTANERPWQVIRGGKTETTYINFVYEPLRAGEGKIKGIICVATDVTEQVIARKKIELAEESARLAIDSADLGTYEINLVTNEVVTSSRFKQIWGFDLGQSEKKDYTAAIHPDDLPGREKAMKESMTTGNLNYEARVVWKDGSVRWVKVKGKHIR
ncbi:MAG TPA: PAS domain-containing protein, partial [Chitinophagaceae bacterium]|nr:PAS domain-containing protein [Chitinophagaceae bacterium]